MASFALRSQRTGEHREFSILDLLRLLGDPVNDEIVLHDGEDVFNLSSFTEIGGPGGQGSSPSRLSVEQYSGGNIFRTGYQPAAHWVIVVLNGIVQTEGKDYSRNGRTISYPFRIESTDVLQIIYPY